MHTGLDACVFIVVLLGTTAADSKQNFMEWMDNLVTSVASEQSKLYTLSGERQQGTFVNLRNQEFGKIVAKLTKLRVWASDIVTNSLTCESFIMVMRGGRGDVSHQGLFIGPFQT